MITLLSVFAVTFLVFLLVIVGMGVGVILGRRQLSGSCGGLANQRDADGNASCSLCSDPDAACQELSHRMQAAGAPQGESRSFSAKKGPDACELDCQTAGCSKEAIDACRSR